MSLQTLLDARGISMYRLSKMSGVSKTVIVDICSGKSALENCTAKTVYAIANVLECTVEDLLRDYSNLNIEKSENTNISSELKSVNYITGIHALNIPCSLDTSGDWHTSALSWTKPFTKNSGTSIWGNYGIELSDNVPENPGKHYVANHIRACLDLISDGKFSVAHSMRKDYICNDDYNEEIFAQVSKLKESPNWEDVCNFMKKEYRSLWLNYERGN